ncbi:MAG: HupE/UreJ family protein [Pseudomonadota bacterium]
MTRWLLPLLLLALWLPGARAHKPSDSYLSITVADDGRLHGRWDIALRDLDHALELDTDGDGRLTWGEVRSRHQEIAGYALARLALRADDADCTLAAGAQALDDHTDGTYTVIPLQIDCARRPSRLTVGYRLFAELDPQHRGLLNLQAPGRNRSAVLGPQAPSQVFELQAGGGWAQFADYAREGVWHIWIGYDHILFLLALLLPAALVWQGRRWQPAPGLREPALDVVRTVTAFTVAHSITLSLAALGVVSLPSRWVESAIALSVVLAALNNVFPVFHGRRWTVAFVFGLIHGFGFASVLADLGLPRDALLLALVGFNVGVELGQLAIVAAFLPLAFGLRRTRLYTRWIFAGGSALIAGVAFVWLLERVFELTLFAF